MFILMSSILTLAEYKYPFQNPNVATIIGSSTLMTEGVTTKVPVKEYKITLPWSEPVPENFWYNEGFKFSLVSQNNQRVIRRRDFKV